MRAWLTPCLSLALLCGCGGTAAFKPTEYPLRAGLVTPLDLSGSVTVVNAQPSTEPLVVYSYGKTLVASPHELSEVMARQATAEIQRDSRKLGGDGVKTIGLRVDSLESENHGAFYQSKMLFQVSLGNGETINLSAAHASGDAETDLDGCLAQGVLALLVDERVKNYLAVEIPAAPEAAPLPDAAPPAPDLPPPGAQPDAAPESQGTLPPQQ